MTYTSFFTKEQAASYKRYLKAAGIYFEASECGEMVVVVVPLDKDTHQEIYNKISTAEYNILFNHCY